MALHKLNKLTNFGLNSEDVSNKITIDVSKDIYN